MNIWSKRGLRPARHRGSFIDGIDVGFRLFGALGGTGLWLLIVVLLATSDAYGIGWLIFAVVAGLPMLGALFFALLTGSAFISDWRWMRAKWEAEHNDRE